MSDATTNLASRLNPLKAKTVLVQGKSRINICYL